MNAGRVSTIVSATLLGLALSAGAGGVTPSAGAATIPAGISGAPAPSGPTSGEEGKTPSADPKSGDQMPGKSTAAHPKRKHTKASGVAHHVRRHHRVGTAVHHHGRKPAGPTTATAPSGAPEDSASHGAPMAG